MDGQMTTLAVKSMLTTLDNVEGGLEQLRQEDADSLAVQPAYDKAERMLARVRCELQDAVDAGKGGA
jgi:hypothetical protein